MAHGWCEQTNLATCNAIYTEVLTSHLAPRSSKLLDEHDTSPAKQVVHLGLKEGFVKSEVVPCTLPLAPQRHTSLNRETCQQVDKARVESTMQLVSQCQAMLFHLILRAMQSDVSMVLHLVIEHPCKKCNVHHTHTSSKHMS